MKIVIQRVKSARVKVEDKILGEIEKGLLLLLGVEKEDDEKDFSYCLRKIPKMRIFEDGEGKMNLSLQDVGGKILLVSQFTLLANTKKGNRPSFVQAADPKKAERIYEKMAEEWRKEGIDVQMGEFGAHMEVELINDGPVTIVIDTKDE